MKTIHRLPGVRRLTPLLLLPWIVLAFEAPIEGAATADPPMIADLELLDNPHNVLSVTLRWSTDVPATSVVEFGEAGTLAHWTGDEDTLTTEHEVVVFGMRSDRTYRIEAVSTGEEGADVRSDPLEFVSGPLPLGGLDPRLGVADRARMHGGWTLANIVSKGILSPVFVVAFDAEGIPVWYHETDSPGGRADVVATLVDGDRILIGGGVAPRGPVEVDMAGNTLWEGPLQDSNEMLADGDMHHVFHKLGNGNYVTLLWDHEGGLHDVIEEFDADGDVLWSWNAGAHVGSSNEYAWGNAVSIDLDEDVAYYNAQRLSKLLKIDRVTGEVLWTLGDDGDFVNETREEDPWFIGAHGPEIQPNGNVLMYDNGDGHRGYSRAVEYALDEDGGEAFIVWEYPGAGTDDHFLNGVWGDADRLANGNTLITAGSTLAGSTEPRLFEVTMDGTKVWELWLESSDPEQRFGAYAAERIPALVGTL